MFYFSFSRKNECLIKSDIFPDIVKIENNHVKRQFYLSTEVSSDWLKTIFVILFKKNIK